MKKKITPFTIPFINQKKKRADLDLVTIIIIIIKKIKYYRFKFKISRMEKKFDYLSYSIKGKLYCSPGLIWSFYFHLKFLHTAHV